MIWKLGDPSVLIRTLDAFLLQTRWQFAESAYLDVQYWLKSGAHHNVDFWSQHIMQSTIGCSLHVASDGLQWQKWLQVDSKSTELQSSLTFFSLKELKNEDTMQLEEYNQDGLLHSTLRDKKLGTRFELKERLN